MIDKPVGAAGVVGAETKNVHSLQSGIVVPVLLCTALAFTLFCPAAAPVTSPGFGPPTGFTVIAGPFVDQLVITLPYWSAVGEQI